MLDINCCQTTSPTTPAPSSHTADGIRVSKGTHSRLCLICHSWCHLPAHPPLEMCTSQNSAGFGSPLQDSHTMSCVLVTELNLTWYCPNSKKPHSNLLRINTHKQICGMHPVTLYQRDLSSAFCPACPSLPNISNPCFASFFCFFPWLTCHPS